MRGPTVHVPDFGQISNCSNSQQKNYLSNCLPVTWPSFKCYCRNHITSVTCNSFNKIYSWQFGAYIAAETHPAFYFGGMALNKVRPLIAPLPNSWMPSGFGIQILAGTDDKTDSNPYSIRSIRFTGFHLPISNLFLGLASQVIHGISTATIKSKINSRYKSKAWINGSCSHFPRTIVANNTRDFGSR